MLTARVRKDSKIIASVLALFFLLMTIISVQNAEAFNYPGNKSSCFIGYRVLSSNSIQFWMDKNTNPNPPNIDQVRLYEGSDTTGRSIVMASLAAGSGNNITGIIGLSGGGSFIINSAEPFLPGQNYTLVVNNTITSNNGYTLGSFYFRKDIVFTFAAPDVVGTPNVNGTYSPLIVPELDFRPENNATNVPHEGIILFTLNVPMDNATASAFSNYSAGTSTLVLKKNGTPLTYDYTIDTIQNGDIYAPIVTDDRTAVFFPMVGGGQATSYNLALDATYTLDIPPIVTINGQIIPPQTISIHSASDILANTIKAAPTATPAGDNLTITWPASLEAYDGNNVLMYPAAVSYNVWASTNPYWNFEKLNTDPILAPTTSFTTSGLQPSTTYYFRVTAVNGVAETGFSPCVSATTPADTTAPTVSSSDPADAATGVAIDKSVAITFSEDIVVGDAYNQTSLKDGSNNDVPFTPSISGSTLTLDPSSALGYSSTYTVTIPAGAVKDAAGNPLASAYTMSFTTAALTYTVTFDSNSGSIVAPITNITPDATVTLPAAPTKEGYTFAGWYTDNTTFANAFTEATPVTANITVYAKWTPLTCTVTFDSNGGSAVAPITNVTSGATVTLPAPPTKAGYIFAGWYTDNTTFANAFTEATQVTADITIYAKWTPIDAVGYAYGYVFDNNSAQTVAVGSDVKFNGDGPSQDIVHTPGDSNIWVEDTGIYNIRFGINTQGNNPQCWGIVVNGLVQQVFNGSGQTLPVESTKLALNAGDCISIRNIATMPNPAVLRTVECNSVWVQIEEVDSAGGYVYQFGTEAIPVGSDVKFSDNGPLQGVTHELGTSTITVNEAGTYNIEFAVNSAACNPQKWGIAVNSVVQSVFNSAGQNGAGSAKLDLNAGDIVSIRNVGTYPDPAVLRTYDSISCWVQIDKVDSAGGYVYEYVAPPGPAQSIPQGSDVKFNSNGPLVNVTHIPGESAITVNEAGIYNIDFAFNSNANNPQYWGVEVNGVVQSIFNCAGQTMVAGTELALNAGDIVSIHNVGTMPDPANLRLDCNSSYVQIDKVGKTEITDTTAPTVSSSDPADAAAGIAIDKTVTITFSEDILAGDAYAQISFKDGSNTDVPFTPAISGNTLTLDPASALGYSSTYTVTVPAGAVKDAAGNAAGALTLTFTTGGEYANITRFDGENRVYTAGNLAAYLYPTGADTVIIAESRKMADSMIGTLLSGILNAPILLADRQTDLDNYSILKGQIASLSPTNVYLLGGSDVVSDDIYNYLQTQGYTVKRIAGADRFDTAVEIIKEAKNHATLGNTLYVANGRGLTDANGLMLAAEGFALAPSADVASNFNPVLLIDKNWTTAEKAARVNTLIDNAGLTSITNCIILGDTTQVPTAVENVLTAKLSGAAITRELGDIYTVSSNLATTYANANGASDVVIARGDILADALTGGLLAGKQNAPLIFVNTDSIPTSANDAINTIVNGASEAYILGGTAAVSDYVAGLINWIIANKSN